MNTLLVAIDPAKMVRDIETVAMSVFHHRLVGLVHVLDGRVVEDPMVIVADIGAQILALLEARAVELEVPDQNVGDIGDLARIAREVLHPSRRR